MCFLITLHLSKTRLICACVTALPIMHNELREWLIYVRGIHRRRLPTCQNYQNQLSTSSHPQSLGVYRLSALMRIGLSVHRRLSNARIAMKIVLI